MRKNIKEIIAYSISLSMVLGCITFASIGGSIHAAEFDGDVITNPFLDYYTTSAEENSSNITDESSTTSAEESSSDITGDSSTTSAEENSSDIIIEQTTTPASNEVNTTTKGDNTTTSPKTTSPSTTNTTGKVTVKRPTILKVKRTKNNKKAKITLKKIKGVAGYRIQYSTTRKFKKKTTKTVSTTKNVRTIRKLKVKKKYYVRAKAYKKVNGKKVFSAKWSKIKVIRVVKK